MKRTFISYSRNDAEFVLDLCQKLSDRGAELWLDQVDIEGGEKWDTQVQEALSAADRIIAVLSESSIESENVADEWSYAIDKGKQIIPIVIEPCETPMRLARIQFIDFTEEYDRSLDKLMVVLDVIKQEKSVYSKKTTDKPAAKKKTKVNSSSPSITTEKNIDTEALSPGLQATAAARKTIWPYALASAMLSISLAVYYVFWFSYTNVPNVEKHSLESATALLKEAKFSSEPILVYEPRSIARDTVLAISPPAGSRVEKNRPLVITLADGTVAISDLVGAHEKSLSALLIDNQLKLGNTIEELHESDEGLVINSNPKSGERVPLHSSIDVYISAPKPVLADVRQLPAMDAVESLAAEGFRVTTEYGVSEEADFGHVYQSEPHAGAKVMPGDTVTLWVAQRSGWVYLKKGRINQSVVAINDMNLRVKPERAARRLGLIRKGEEVVVLDRLSSWRKIVVKEAMAGHQLSTK